MEVRRKRPTRHFFLLRNPYKTSIFKLNNNVKLGVMPMHNTVSFNHLNSWVPYNKQNPDPIDEYFECMVECNEGDRTCALECRTLLG